MFCGFRRLNRQENHPDVWRGLVSFIRSQAHILICTDLEPILNQPRDRLLLARKWSFPRAEAKGLESASWAVVPQFQNQRCKFIAS